MKNLTFAIALFFVACQPQSDKPEQLSLDDYEIYSLLINKCYPEKYDLPNRYIGILYSTVKVRWVHPSRAFELNDTLSTLDDTTSEEAATILRSSSNSMDFDSMISNLSVAKDIVFDSSAFNLQSKYKMVHPNQNRMINIPPDSSLRGVVICSRITFNSKRDEAVVYFYEGKRFEPYSADFLLRKKGSVWVIIAEVSEL